MIANYHTHSRWCRHAGGEIEEYIETAIANGFVELALTEHSPHSTMYSWVPWEEVPLFNEALDAAIARYRNQIRLIKGLECEYVPSEMENYHRFREEMGVTFMLLGQHVIGEKEPIGAFDAKGPKEIRVYADAVCAGLETGMFDMLAHPEVAMTRYQGKNGFECLDYDAKQAMMQVFSACEKLQIPVEMNAGGRRGRRPYPLREVWELSKDFNLQCLIGSDAHQPGEIYDRAVKEVETMAEELGIHVLPTFPWKNSTQR